MTWFLCVRMIDVNAVINLSGSGLGQVRLCLCPFGACPQGYRHCGRRRLQEVFEVCRHQGRVHQHVRQHQDPRQLHQGCFCRFAAHLLVLVT